MSAAERPGALDRVPLRLHIDHLRLEGTASILGPVMREELALEIEARLAELVQAHGAPTLAVGGGAGGGAVRLDGATVRLTPGVTRDEVAPAIARQIYEQLYGPLSPWGTSVGVGADPVPGAGSPTETSRPATGGNPADREEDETA